MLDAQSKNVDQIENRGNANEASLTKNENGSKTNRVNENALLKQLIEQLYRDK